MWSANDQWVTSRCFCLRSEDLWGISNDQCITSKPFCLRSDLCAISKWSMSHFKVLLPEIRGSLRDQQWPMYYFKALLPKISNDQWVTSRHSCLRSEDLCGISRWSTCCSLVHLSSQVFLHSVKSFIQTKICTYIHTFIVLYTVIFHVKKISEKVDKPKHRQWIQE